MAHSQKIISYLQVICFYGVLFGLSCLLIDRMVVGSTTIKLQVGFAKSLSEGVTHVPHLGFFYLLWFFKVLTGLSYEVSASLILGMFVTLNAWTIHFVFKRLLPQLSTIQVIGLTVMCMTVGAIYLPFFNSSVYFGQGSPIMYHNATVIAIKALAVLGFFMMIRFLEDKAKQNSWKYTGVISLVLLLSVFIKGTFVLIFFPAIGLYIIVRFTREFSLYWKIFLMALPSIILLCYQFLSFDFENSRQGIRTHEIDFLRIWRMFTPNVGISILLALAFPITILAFRFKQVIKNQYFIIACITMFIGMLQFALFAEYSITGEIITSANWIGGYLIGLTLLFVFSIFEYGKWLSESNLSDNLRNLGVWVTTIILIMHILSGFYYIYELYVFGKTLVNWQ